MAANVVGIILKLDFGDKSEVYDDSYLSELMQQKSWYTPRRYAGLDGVGRKLYFYDRTRKAITAEVKIGSIVKTGEDANYPWRNSFEPGTIRVYKSPIPRAKLHSIMGFENLGTPRKDRTPYRNVTPAQDLKIMRLRRKMAG